MDFFIYLFAIAVVFASQTILSGSYQKYRKMPTVHGMKGYEVAKYILEKNGIYDVSIVPSKGGTLSDYYDPTHKVVNLSSDIYYNSSIASVSVAAHEVGHALQHAQGYSLIVLRNKLLPITQIASQLGWVSIFLGLFLSSNMLFEIGVIMLIIILCFQLVTLPIELNASNRAVAQLTNLNIIEESEVSSSKKMLKAAAFTYIAALISTFAQIIRVLLIRGNRRD
ncbi:MAG: zinc metallopeptidase [Traorella sp.]